MQSRGRAPPQGRPLHIKIQLVLVVALCSLLGLAHALQANERELDRLSEEFAESSKQIAERLDDLEQELEQTRKQVAETSVLTTRSVETMVRDLRAAKRKLSTRVAALEHRVAALEIESKHAADEVIDCSMLHVSPVKETFQAASDRT